MSNYKLMKLNKADRNILTPQNTSYSKEYCDAAGMYHDFEQISKGNGNILDVIGNNIRNAGFDPPRDVQKIRYN